MHYYQFNIKDYSFVAMRLSLLEDLAFRRMLDYFYETEKPLPFELDRVSKLIGMRDHQEEVRQILNEFWIETEHGWVNSRAQEEINTYQSKADTARANGKKGGRPKNQEKTQLVNSANQIESESKTNHKPITNNHKPITSSKRFTPPTLIESIDYFVSKGSNNFEGDKFFNFYESKNWYVGKSKMKNWKSAANGWISRNKTANQQNDILEQSANSDWHLVENKGF